MLIDFSALSRSSVMGSLLRSALRILPPSMVVPIIQGPIRGKKWIIGSCTNGCWLGTYEHHTIDVFQAMVPEGGIVYDIGANVGYYTLVAAKLVRSSGHVYAFEPVPRNCELLSKHLAINGIDNVSVIEAAVSSAVSEARFDPHPGPSMGHLAAEGSLRVRCLTLDDFVFNQGMRPPDVIKIDVEGAEADVLKGGRELFRRCRPMVLLATHSDEVQRECRRLLESYGFTVEALNGMPLDQADQFVAKPSGAM